MRDLWDSLPVLAQDIALLLGLLLPLVLCATGLLYRFAPWPLVRAVLWRFRWANLMFIALIAISVGMGIGVMAQERGLRKGMAEAADKFDLVITAPGSEMTMMLATVFLQPSDVPLLGGAIYSEIDAHPNVAIAAPLAFGDSYEDNPVIGTTAAFARHLADDGIEGRMWATTTEALAGAAVPLNIGDQFTPVHGVGDAVEDDAHAGTHLTITGRLPRSGTPWDRAILVPVESVWAVHGLASGHAPDRADQIGPPFDAAYFPGTPAVIVRADELWANYALRSEFNRDAETMAFFPGTVLAELYRVMGDVRQAMSLMTVVTQVLVAASVLLGLFILSRLFQRQTAMLRALGAPRRFVMAVIWSYGAVLLSIGTLCGLGTGVVAASILSRIVSARTDVLVSASLSWTEFHLAAAFLAITSLLSLLPALVVLRQPVAEGLRA